jgi:hypothetical protein
MWGVANVTPHIFLSKNPRGENLVQVADITSGITDQLPEGVQMESLPEVWEKLEFVTGVLKEMVKPEYKVTHQELTDVRDDLNACAESVQIIRDRIVFE